MYKSLSRTNESPIEVLRACACVFLEDSGSFVTNKLMTFCIKKHYFPLSYIYIHMSIYTVHHDLFLCSNKLLHYNENLRRITIDNNGIYKKSSINASHSCFCGSTRTCIRESWFLLQNGTRENGLMILFLSSTRCMRCMYERTRGTTPCSFICVILKPKTTHKALFSIVSHRHAV